VRPAYEFNVPPVAQLCSAKATAPGSLLTINAPNVIVECVKWAEKGRARRGGQAFVVRLYEAGGAGTQVRVDLNVPLKSVHATNLLEENPVALDVQEGGVTFGMHPFEIKTLLCAV